MRVITGSARSIPLISLDPRTVPLSDRAKTSLFNIITPKIEGASVLDLYAGSGALGIEALSRGAKHATFVDISKKAVESIQRNLAKTHLIERAIVENENIIMFLKEADEEYDIIFVCPPYDDVVYHFVERAAEYVAPGGLLIFEHHIKDKFREIKSLRKIDERSYGIVNFEIYQRA
jgi:16S rRNA (guanine966-N2)-methyltransferase